MSLIRSSKCDVGAINNNMTMLTFTQFLIEGFKVTHKKVGDNTKSQVDYVDDGDDNHHVIKKLGKERWHKNNVSKELSVADQPERSLPHPVNAKEAHEMSTAGMQAYGKFHVYFGGYLRNGGKGKTKHKADYQGILSSIKERDGNTITPQAKQKLYNDAAAEIVRQIRFETNMPKDDTRQESPLHKAAKVLLVPVPSSSTVPQDFAKVLASKLHTDSREVTIAKPGELVVPNLNYDVYPDHHRVAKKGVNAGERMDKKTILASYRGHVVSDVKEGRRTPEQAIRMLEANKQHIEMTIERGTDDEEGIAGLDHIDAIDEIIEEIKKTKPGVGTQTARKYANMRPMDRRNNVYNRMKVPTPKIGNTVDDDTVVVLVDDNIEEGSSIFQTYRALLKGGVVKSSHAVVGAVAHKLSVAQ